MEGGKGVSLCGLSSGFWFYQWSSDYPPSGISIFDNTEYLGSLHLAASSWFVLVQGTNRHQYSFQGKTLKVCSFKIRFFFFFFNFIFKIYITVLVLPNIKMNPPQVYMCFLKLL